MKFLIWKRTALFFFLGASLCRASADHGSPRPLHASDDLSSCSNILRVVSEIAMLTQHFPSNSPLLLPATSTYDAIESSQFAPGWVKQLVVLQRQFQPQLDLVYFLDSEAVKRVTALQLRALGFDSGETAFGFLGKFPTLELDRQIAFANGLVFRLLWETLNNLPAEQNRARLGLDPQAFEALHSVLSRLAGTDYRNLALALLCQFGFRNTAMAESVRSQWEITRSYEPPLPKALRSWTKLHGVLVDPRTGKRAENERDLVWLLTASVSLDAKEAIGFLLDKELPHLTNAQVAAVRAVAGLPPHVLDRIDEWEAGDISGFSPKDAGAMRNRLIRTTKGELEVVETRIKLLVWAKNLQGIADPAEVVNSLREQIRQCVASGSRNSCDWVSAGVRILLKWMGFDPGALGSHVLGGILSDIVVTISSNSSYGTQLGAMLDQMHLQALPIVAFAKEIATQPSTAMDLPALEERKTKLLQKLEWLERGQPPALSSSR